MSPLNCFFFNDTATTEIYTLSLHDALPISSSPPSRSSTTTWLALNPFTVPRKACSKAPRSEEHTSELQSRPHLVCRLLLDKMRPWRLFNLGVGLSLNSGAPYTITTRRDDNS